MENVECYCLWWDFFSFRSSRVGNKKSFLFFFSGGKICNNFCLVLLSLKKKSLWLFVFKWLWIFLIDFTFVFWISRLLCQTETAERNFHEDLDNNNRRRKKICFYLTVKCKERQEARALSHDCVWVKNSFSFFWCLIVLSEMWVDWNAEVKSLAQYHYFQQANICVILDLKNTAFHTELFYGCHYDLCTYTINDCRKSYSEC